MLPDDLDDLRNLCKNDQCFQELRTIITGIMEERDRKERVLSLLESATDDCYESIMITDLNLEKPGPEIVYVNNGFCEMTGYAKEEVIGRTPRFLQGPKTDRNVLERLKERLLNGQCFFGQTVNYRKDGSEFINQWDVHPLADEKGNLTHWVSYQHDISARKNVEQQFIDTKVEFDDLHEQARCTTIDIDLRGNIISANHAFLSFTGYEEHELKQQKAWVLFPDKYRDMLRKYFDEAEGEALLHGREFKGIIKHKSGLHIQVKGISRLLNLRDRPVIRVEIQNISLQKKILDTLQQYQQ